ncbi:MAG: hypothetical protein ACM33U_01115 [Solirubrobacterales bacterium]|jgi:hypothetical protein|nr:hypothetical protein [Solirubrobacterales bacterium]
MDASRLDRSEIIGMIAAALLVVSLFLEWFSLSTDPSVVQRGNDPANWACGVGESSCSAWHTFPILRWLLLAAAAAPFILAWIVVRGHALSWPRGELTAIVGLTAFVLIAYNGIVAKPQDGLEISLSFGYWLALLASVGIFVTGASRAVESGGGARRKPPATF